MNLGEPEIITLRNQIFNIDEILNNIDSILENLYFRQNIFGDHLSREYPDFQYLNNIFNEYLQNFNNLTYQHQLLDIEIQRICDPLTQYNVEKCKKYFDNLSIMSFLFNL